MATAGASDAEDLLTCSVCLEEFHDPRSLNCLHTFCFQCLDAITKHVPGRGHLCSIILCPVCWQETPLPESGVNGLKKDFKIEQMKKLLDTSTKKSNKAHAVGRMCDACKGDNKSIASFLCMSCLVFFCEKCVKKHNENLMLQDHIVNAVQRNMGYCMVHVGQAVGYVCQCEPDVLLCALCIMDHDKEHEVQTISQARHTLLSNILEVVNVTKKDLQGHLDDINRMTNRYEAMVIKVEKRIKEQAKRLMDEIARKEAEMIKEAHDTVKEVLTKYQAHRITSRLQYTERVEDYINQMIHVSDDSSYLKEANLQQQFMKFKGKYRPKAIPETGITFVPPDRMPRIHLGVLEGTRRAEPRKNDGLHSKNKIYDGPIIILD